MQHTRRELGRVTEKQGGGGPYQGLGLGVVGGPTQRKSLVSATQEEQHHRGLGSVQLDVHWNRSLTQRVFPTRGCSNTRLQTWGPEKQKLSSRRSGGQKPEIKGPRAAAPKAGRKDPSCRGFRPLPPPPHGPLLSESSLPSPLRRLVIGLEAHLQDPARSRPSRTASLRHNLHTTLCTLKGCTVLI